MGLKNFRLKNIMGRKILGKKNFCQKDLDPIFFIKKQVGLTQGGRYRTPPQKIVGLKLC